MEKQNRVALYVRTSTVDKQDTEMQLRELKQYAEIRGWQIVEVYEDKGFSGKNAKRPALMRLQKAAGQREFDILAVWKLDRLGRSLGDLISIIRGLSDVGVEFISLKDNLDLTTSQGRLLLHMLGAFAEFERDLITIRVRSGLEAARARGKRLGRPRLDKASDVRELVSKGLSQRQIAKRLGISKGTVGNLITKRPKNLSRVTAITS